MNQMLLMLAILLFLCLLLGHLGGKVGVPSLLLFIGLGMLASTFHLASEYRSFQFANTFSTLGLIFIMFYGGFGTNWKRAKKVSLQAGLLSTAGVMLTALLVMLFAHFALQASWLSSLLLGSVISSTDAASVFHILRSHHLNLRYGTASLLELESGSNDPSASIMVILSLSLMQGQATVGSVVLLMLREFAFGILLGFAVGWLAVWLMEHVPMTGESDSIIFVIAAALCAYAAAECLDGNGYLAAYLAGIVMGNNPIPGRKVLVHFFDGITGLMQVLIFFLLGLVFTGSTLLQCVLPGLLVALFLTFVARPLVVLALMAPFHAPQKQRLLVDWCGVRGASAIVFAIVAAVSPATGTEIDQLLFHTVFFIVLFSILLQGTLIPFVTRKLNMIDDHEDVMQSFSDWSEDRPVDFIQIRITPEHPWCDHLLMEARPSVVLGGGRIAMIIRDNQQITPKGSTRLKEGDIVVVAGESVDGKSWGTLNEVSISAGHAWAGKRVFELFLEEGTSLVAVQREGKLLIPDGNTLICTGDLVVLNETRSKLS